MTVSGVALEIEERGQGRPLLFLHPGEGLRPNRPWLEELARSFRVIAPHHPGFGSSALPDWLATVDDLAYLYLDLAAALKLEGAVLVGACFGGWVAAEIAVRNTQRFAGLLLSAPLGIKVGGVLDRDITDMHAIPRTEFMRRAWERRGPAELLDVVEAGEKVVVIMRPAPDGTGEPAPAANVSTFRDGKVVEMVHYPDPRDALAAAGIAGSA